MSIAETFENIAGYEKKHAADRPMDQGWQESMTSNDVVSSQDDLLQQWPYEAKRSPRRQTLVG